MAKIGFSRPAGRVEVHYPDCMSLDELEETLRVHLGVCRLALAAPNKPPVTGRQGVADLT